MELAPKPAEQRWPAISVSAINELLRATPRVLTGDGVLLKKFGDRWIVEQTGNYVYASEYVQYFVVMEEFADYLKCVIFYYTNTEQPYAEDLGEQQQALGLTGSIMYVAKPPWLQQSIWNNVTLGIDGMPVAFQYTDVNQRYAVPQFPIDSAFYTLKDEPLPYRAPTRLQSISPGYVVGSVIVAKQGPTGLSCVDDEGVAQDIFWQDMNDAGRNWQDNSLPQILTLVFGTPYVTNGQRYYNAVWNIRNNSAFAWDAQTPVWVQDLSGSTSLVTGVQYSGIFAGRESAGPGPQERPLYQIQSTPPAIFHGCKTVIALTTLTHGVAHIPTINVDGWDTDGFLQGNQFTIPSGLGGKYKIMCLVQYHTPVTIGANYQTKTTLKSGTGTLTTGSVDYCLLGESQCLTGTLGFGAQSCLHSGSVELNLSDGDSVAIQVYQANSIPANGPMTIDVAGYGLWSGFWLEKIG